MTRNYTTESPFGSKMEFSARPLDVCFTKNGNRKTVAKSGSAKSGSERSHSITSSAARIQGSARDTKSAADAAKLNALAVINADRAHLYVIIAQHNVSELIAAVAGAKFSEAIAKDRMEPPILSYVFKNYGKTPAIIERVMHCVALKKGEGGTRTYEAFDRALEIIGEREEVEPIATSFNERPFLCEDAKALGDHDIDLFFYSEVTFRDAFNQRHTIGSDFLYSAGRFHLISRKETTETT